MPTHPADSADGRSRDVRVAGVPPRRTEAPRHAEPSRDTEPMPHGDPLPHAAPAARPASPEQTAPTRPDRPSPAHAAPTRPELAKEEVATRFPEPNADSGSGRDDRLMAPAEAQRFRERWRDVQASFVDDPGEAVQRADRLAAEVVDALGQALTARRRALNEHWNSGEGDTERLRRALRDYRGLVDRILGA
ncbi:hypothetical protein ABZ801_32415 [Actinomadura sp. NPDC047616]|uniref:hypothetical protein n=1 Tax=Actinomadura sp. NPDC047616 TaxID=3155914 RepID=UPI003406E0B8